MAADNRDWYRDWWRKRTGYVERSAFRVSEGERKRASHSAAWRKNWIALGVIVVFLTLVVVLVRF